MALAMRAAAKAGVKVIVLDRPNPIGGLQIEGGGLEPGLENFCGLYPVPQRHAMTVGELARLYNPRAGCDLDVVPRRMAPIVLRRNRASVRCRRPTCRRWTPRSCTRPAYWKPTFRRGAARGPSVVGAPFVIPRARGRLGGYGLLWCCSCVFQPTFDKHTGKLWCSADSRRDRGTLTHIEPVLPCSSRSSLSKDSPGERRRCLTSVPAIDLLTGGRRALPRCRPRPRRSGCCGTRQLEL
jgi:hypothetical protein